MPWVVGSFIAVVVAALAITVVLTLGGEDDDAGGGPAAGYDLSSPEAAAKSLAAAAKTGNADTYLSLTCFGNNACLARREPGIPPEDVKAARNELKSRMGKIAERLDGAQFGEAKTASEEPDAMEVPYRKEDEHGSYESTLIMVESDGNWFYWANGSGVTVGPGTFDPPTSGR